MKQLYKRRAYISWCIYTDWWTELAQVRAVLGSLKKTHLILHPIFAIMQFGMHHGVLPVQSCQVYLAKTAASMNVIPS